MCAYEDDRNYGNPFHPMLTEVPYHYAGQAGADEGVRIIAQQIASDMIEAARTSGDDPIAWVTSNRYMPPLRSYPQAETVWQAAYPEDNNFVSYWEFLVEEMERLLSEAEVALESPEYDNSLYVVDLKRFEYSEDSEGENLQDDWILIEA